MNNLDAKTSRVEIGISEGWARENPGLFVETVLKFTRDYPTPEWVRTILPDYMPGSAVMLVATRSTTATVTKHPRVAVIVQDGLVQCVVSDDPKLEAVRFMVIDYDIEGASPEDFATWPNELEPGKTEAAFVRVDAIMKAKSPLASIFAASNRARGTGDE